MSDKIILCRRQLQDFGEPARYCCGDIVKPNPLDWCAACCARLPLWPNQLIDLSSEPLKFPDAPLPVPAVSVPELEMELPL